MAKVRKQTAEAPPVDDGKPKLEDLRKMAEDAMDLQDLARQQSQMDQDYYDDIQWTADEKRILEARGQPCLTFNHVKPAVNAIVGIRERSKVDPKAWGRTPKDQDAAEIFTDGLRYVSDVTRFNNTKRSALFQLAIWGITGGLVEVDETGSELTTQKIDPRDYFYDPFSRELDFSDARYDGIAKWMDIGAVVDMHPGYSTHLTDTLKHAPVTPESFTDRPINAVRGWADRQKQRVLLIEMYHKYKGTWWKSVFCWGALLESGPSPYFEFMPGGRKRPKKCTVTQSCYVDRENRRYGVVRAMRGPQDAINKGRSKAVHILNVRQMRVEPGVMDEDEVRREAAKADGLFRAREGQVEILATHTQFMPAHLELMRDAKGEMTRQSPSPGIVGRQASSQSGIAIQREQEAGLTEQAPLLAAFDDWVFRMYRSMADGIKQFWTDEKHIRVTDDESAPKFLVMNEVIVDPMTGQPVIDPRTGQPAMRNVPSEMDVDLVIDVTPDTAVIQEDQFDKLVEIEKARPGSFPPDVLIEASSLPKKRLILDKMKQEQQESQGKPGPEQAMMAAEAQKAQLQLQTEQQKAQLQLQSKEQMAQIDAQAHAAQLQREDASEQAKAQRQAMLEQQKFDNDMARLQATAQSDAQKVQLQIDSDRAKKQDEIDHAGRQKQMDFHFRTKDAQLAHGIKMAEADGGEMGDDLKTKPPAHMEALGQGLRDIAASLAMLSKPRRLVKDPRTGEKRVEVAFEALN